MENIRTKFPSTEGEKKSNSVLELDLQLADRQRLVLSAVPGVEKLLLELLDPALEVCHLGKERSLCEETSGQRYSGEITANLFSMPLLSRLERVLSVDETELQVDQLVVALLPARDQYCQPFLLPRNQHSWA